MERAFDADFTQGRGPLPRARRHRRAAHAVVRGPHARRGAQGARRARRVLGSVPDVHAAARRRLAGVGRRTRCSATSTTPASARCARPASPLRFPTEPPVAARAGAAARHAHRRGARRRARPLAAPRSAACTTTAWSPARSPRRMSDRAAPRRHRLRRRLRELAHDPVASSRRRGSRRASTPIPRVLDHGVLPALVALGAASSRRCRPPSSASTATRAAGPRWTTFPQRMWVGGRVRVDAPARASAIDAERRSRIVRGRR